MIKRFIGNSIIGLVLSMLWAASASATLIVNGGFEAPTGDAIGGGPGWNYYASSDIPGWDGDNLELWTGRSPSAYEGDYHAELNAHGANTGAWSIFQTFNTTAGQTYDLFFAYSARVGDTQSSDEIFNVKVDGLNFDITDHVTGSWSTYSTSFVADDASATLRFTSVFPTSRTLGNFLDDIRVTAAVPEPSIIALLAFGLLGLGFSRKRISTSS